MRIFPTLGAAVIGFVAGLLVAGGEDSDPLPGVQAPEARPVPRRRVVPVRQRTVVHSVEVPVEREDRADLRAEILAELEEERRARHREHHAQMLERRLDDVAAFASEWELTDSTTVRLREAVEALHVRMEEVGPPQGPPGSGPPGEDDERHAAFVDFRQEVDDVLDDAELADAFHEWMRPRRGPPGG